MTGSWVRLEKLETTSKKLRTPSVSGWCRELPRVGFPFYLYAEPIQSDRDLRQVNTTIVLSVEMVEREMFFRTKNSLYKLTIE